MNYVRSFVPWIVFAFIATRMDWRFSALIGLGTALVLLLWARKERRPAEATVMETSAVIFFALIAIFAFVDRFSALHDYVVALASGWLALTAWGSLAVRRPFTLGIAKQMTDPAGWLNPRFRAVNNVLSSVWAISFTAEAVLLALVLSYAPHATVAVIIVKALCWALPVAFTLGYPAVLRARAARQVA
jgi:hypothetical protein